MILFDTSVLVASILENHPHFEKSNLWLQKVVSGKSKGAVSNHCLAELYSALTTIPVVPRIRSDQAFQLIEESVLKYFKIYEYKIQDYTDVLKESSLNSLKGGLVYDALHIQAAKKLKASFVLTFNLKHFLMIWPDGKKILKSP